LFQLFAKGVIDTSGKFTAGIITPVAKFATGSTTPAVLMAKFAASVVDTCGAP
jgi:hypothetical protein